jgi:hypothetical protein
MRAQPQTLKDQRLRQHGRLVLPAWNWTLHNVPTVPSPTLPSGAVLGEKSQVNFKSRRRHTANRLGTSRYVEIVQRAEAMRVDRRKSRIYIIVTNPHTNQQRRM